MGRVLYLDCFSGASGDMLLGACLDAGLPLDSLREAIAGLGVDGVGVTAEPVRRHGIRATKFSVVQPAAHGGHTEAEHGHRHLPHILRLIEASGLSSTAKARAAALFERLAEAEAGVHGIPPERVHFHEVGAIDSIVDIVGAVFAFEWFGATRVVASPLNTGSGTVQCAHGLLPVPAPATARLIAGVPVYADGPATELLTPTGALLVTGHATEYGPLPPMRIERIGYGAGDRELADRPNVVRLVTGTELDSDALASMPLVGEAAERLTVLECEVDDLNPQVFGVLMSGLLEAGARDVFYTAVQMKKGRPGTLVTVLADPASRERLLERLFAETTSLGVRMHEVVRETLARESVPVTTAYGPVRMKIARRRGRVVNAAPEFDDCARLAAERGVAVKAVLASAMHAWLGVAGEGGDPLP